jgi:hypothetical protein
MRALQRAKAGAALAASLTTVAGPVTGDNAPARQRAKLEFRVIATWSGGETRSIGGFGMGPLEEGGSMTGNMQFNLLPTTEGSPCQTNVTMTASPTMTVSSPKATEGPLPSWQVEGKVRRAEMDNIQVAFAWKRRSGAGTGSLPEASDQGEATLSEGGRVLLDFVPVLEASSGCIRNVALELAASIPEDPAFKDRRIGYDLWLVSEDHGKRLTRRLQLIGKQGESIAFDYGMFRSKLPVAPRPDNGSDLMETTVAGSIRSRIQPDGSIEVLLAAHREARPSDRIWATYASGSKRVRALAGETLRLELPPPKAIDGVDEPATFEALAEQRVALILTPTPVE